MSDPTLVRRLRGATIAVLGDLVADEYVFGETDRVSREAPVLIVRWESTETKLGGAANVAANVAALGAKARPVGLVGDDAAGRAMLGLFEGLGADTRHVLRARGRVTETKTRILAGGRSTTRQQMLRLDRADDAPPTPAMRRRLAGLLEDAAREADALVVSDYGSGLVDDALRATVRRIAGKIPVCVDSRYGLRAFTGVTLVKPNEPELEAAVGHRLRTDADVERAGRLLLDQLEAKALVVTRGRKGLWLFEKKRETVRIPVYGPEEAVDVTGAGDTVLATLASALGAGASIEGAARLANVAGGLVVQKPGTATVSHAELSSALGGEAPSRRRRG